MGSLKDIYSSHQNKLSDKWSIYIPEYDRIFYSYKNEKINLLEIGVQNGGSIEIWSTYFEQAVNLVGCDINTDCGKLSYEDERVTIIIGDAGDSETKCKVLEQSDKFDIVIDDGSHRSSDIVKAFMAYFPVINDGGVFIAEDLHCSYWFEFEGGIYDPYSSIAFFKRLADIVNYEHFGLNKERRELLDGFSKKYNCRITDEDLSKIHSVEFINSMCVIKKLKPENNVLGVRIAAGNIEDVVKGHHDLSDECYFVPNQSGKSNALTIMPIEENIIKKLSEIEEYKENLKQAYLEIDDLRLIILGYKESLSWKMTLPLRYVKKIIYTLYGFF